MEPLKMPAIVKGPRRPAPEPVPVCATCSGAGWLRYDVEVGDPNFGEVVPCRNCSGPKLKAQLWLASGLVDEDRGSTFEAFEVVPGTEEALAAAKALADRQPPRRPPPPKKGGAPPHNEQAPPILVLSGLPGRGKTHLAHGICLYRLERGLPAQFWVVPALLDWLRQGYTDGDFEVRFQGVLNCPLLVLDDLGMQQTKDWVTERLDMIVNHRWGREMEMVITANPESATTERIMSRIQDRRRARVIQIPLWVKDYRLEG